MKPAILKLTEEQRGSATVLPTHAPVPATSTGIGPGSQLMMDRPDGAFVCTANFVWTATKQVPVLRPNGRPSRRTTTVKTYYLGAAGHCFVPAEKATTHGPDADFDRMQTDVSVCVADCEFGDQLGPVFGTFVDLGPVAYARQTARGEDFANDFGIVEIPASLVDQIRPEVPVWEGPSSIQEVPNGGTVCLYGNGTAVGAVFATKARAGLGEGLGDNKRYWRSRTPSAPGDSGSALVTCEPDADGYHGLGAAGILTHIGGTLETARVIGTTVPRAVEMTRDDAGIDLKLMLEDGTEVTVPSLEPREPAGPVITPDEPVNAVGVGGSYSWTAGPFTRTAPADEGTFESACSGRDPKTEHCDYEFFDLDVPLSGADLTVTVSTADATATDFDVYVYDQNGTQVASAASSGTPPEVATASISMSGPYTVAVNPYQTTDASYSATLELAEPPPPPPVPHEAELSVGQTHTWSGDPAGDVNPLFTCADLVMDLCDNETIQLNVPAAGATLDVTVSADAEGDDFDVCVYSPSNDQTCVSETGDEHLVLPVTDAGVYRVGVKAYTALGTFSASASLN